MINGSGFIIGDVFELLFVLVMSLNEHFLFW